MFEKVTQLLHEQVGDKCNFCVSKYIFMLAYPGRDRYRRVLLRTSLPTTQNISLRIGFVLHQVNCVFEW